MFGFLVFLAFLMGLTALTTDCWSQWRSFRGCGRLGLVSSMVLRAGCPSPEGLNRLLKKWWREPQSTSAAKAVTENEPVVAAVNRCATQKQEQNRVFQHSVKPAFLSAFNGTAVSRALPNPFMRPVLELRPSAIGCEVK